MKKLSLLIGCLFLSLVCFAQWDEPGFDDFYHLNYPNPYGRLFKGGGVYPSTPYRTEYYRAVGKDTGFEIPFVWNHFNAVCSIGGDTQIITPTQGLLGVPLLWSKGLSGRDVRVGVIDEGYSGLIPHKSITVQGTFNAYGDNNQEFETQAHTTAILSIIAGRPNHEGRVLGTAYNSQLYAASWSDPAASLHYLIDSVQCDIISLSFLANPDSEMISIATRFANNGGIFVVAAGNNSSLDTLNPLCTLPGAVCVTGMVGGGSLEILDSFRYKSLIPWHGKSIDFAVPHLSVGAWWDNPIGEAPTGGDPLNFYSLISGTSFCAPNVAGYLALLLEYYRGKYVCYPGKAVVRLAIQHGRVITNVGYQAVVPTSDWIP